jgi:hypothetical protein
MPSISETWGTEPRERQLVFPCDGLILRPDAALYRGVTIDAAPRAVFRWLCQMRVAPYSYDWIDNGGRESPRELTPGLDNLAIGQDVMRIFDLVGFEQDRHLTLRLKPRSGASRTFGDIAVTYLVVPPDHRLAPSANYAPADNPAANNRCRLLVKLIVGYPRGLKGRMMQLVLPWGDLVMMRRQLLNLKSLAEGVKGQKTTNGQD